MPRDRKAVAERKRRERAAATEVVRAALEEGATPNAKRKAKNLPDYQLNDAMCDLIEWRNPYGHNDPTAAIAMRRMTKKELRTARDA